MVTIINFAD